MTTVTRTKLTDEDFVQYYQDNPAALLEFIKVAREIAEEYILLVDKYEAMKQEATK